MELDTKRQVRPSATFVFIMEFDGHEGAEKYYFYFLECLLPVWLYLNVSDTVPTVDQRGCSMRFLMSGFLHESIVPIPLSNILKYF